MFATYPFTFEPNAEETYVRYLFDVNEWLETPIEVQWLKPYFIIGTAREMNLAGVENSQLFFRPPQLIYRALVRGEIPTPRPRQFVQNHIESGGILRPENELLWVFDCAEYKDKDDPDGPHLLFCLLITSLSGTDYNPVV